MARNAPDLFTPPQARNLLSSSSRNKKTATSYATIPVMSPSPREIPSFMNPFEHHHLAERLKGPVIESPSLFHRPPTPVQLNSPSFEWTIDDVSALAPANVEVSDLQFSQYVDDDFEERAQAAITKFFKEHDVVPSPSDRTVQQLRLLQSNELTRSASNIRKKTRDSMCQSTLSFPPELPQEVDDVLAQYFTFSEHREEINESRGCDKSVNYEARDASLRRKLFEIDASSDDESLIPEFDLKDMSPAPKTPELESEKISTQTRNFGTPLANNNKSLNISVSPVRKESFGCLSPISKPIRANLSLYRSTPEKELGIDMSVDEREIIDWAELSYNEVISSTMTQSKIMRKGITPSRRKKPYGKNLSHSFSRQNSIDDNLTTGEGQKSLTFYRSDSGFTESSDSPPDFTVPGTYTDNDIMDVSMRSDY